MRLTLATGLAMLGFLAMAPVSASAFNFTEVRYEGTPESGAQIAVEAAPGTANSIVAVLIGIQGEPRLVLEDAAGVTVGDSAQPHCAVVSATEVRCEATGLERVELDSGDGEDRVGLGFRPSDLDNVTIGEVVVQTGSGDDRLRAPSSMPPTGTVTFALGEGHDHAAVGVHLGTSDLQNAENVIARGEGGRDRIALTGAGTIAGGSGGDWLRGGAGPQRIFGDEGADAIACGRGRDVAHGGPGNDRGGAGCERTFAMVDGSVRFRRTINWRLRGSA